ncbi:hypothetical protein EII29_00670 [Leptotrichia sp. OH3620_COT-345]|uniref:hypothetical protein n=1 Tax=Leptotrichia sp. OH3620_COT-345 TaxID=2491048 RepID=UPI000F64C680|nr:hypothetical protein [Leptotrichia sp. OH3620_COT-345]RRD40998.1 hypothetical protein EII29_00670 [Leptotrichia sp. OH3620_COT-345]
MNKKLLWGTVIILLSIFYGIQTLFPDFLSESVMKYIFNYQMILILIGVFFIVKKSKLGWFVLAIGFYLYFQQFLGEYFTKGLPILTLIGGIVLVTLGFKETNVGKPKKDKKAFKPSEAAEENKENKEEIVDAEEVK